VKNTLDVEVGDLILVSVPQSGLLLASLVMYCLPLTMLILVAMVAEAATSFPEPVIVILSFAGLLLGLLMSRYLSKRLERSVSASVNMVCKLDPQLMLQTE
jgi:sigma-E factor negative regulatory protein RseC